MSAKSVSLVLLLWVNSLSAASTEVCISKASDTECLSDESLAVHQGSFARISSQWQVGRFGVYQRIWVAKEKAASPYPQLTELSVIMSQDFHGGLRPEATEQACARLAELGVSCRTGLVEGTWINHAPDLSGTLFTFTPSGHDFGMEQGKLQVEWACADDATATLVCEAPYTAQGTVKFEQRWDVELEASPKQWTCAKEARRARLTRSIACEDASAFIQSVQKKFQHMSWTNSYAMRVLDAAGYNHYLSGY